MLIAKGLFVAVAVFVGLIFAFICWWFVVMARSGGVLVDLRPFISAGQFMLGLGLGFAGIGTGVWVLSQVVMSYLAKKLAG
jgi:hypothetical protein